MWKASWELIKNVKSHDQWKQAVTRLGLKKETIEKCKTTEEYGRLAFMQSLTEEPIEED